MAPSRILISGIDGLIGGVLQAALAGKYEVYGLDATGPFSNRVLKADISDYKQTAHVIRQLSPLDAIVHLAGNPRVTAAWDEVLSANIIGTRNMFEAEREFRIPRMVFASSNHVTGGYEGIESNYFLHRQTEPVKIFTKDPVRPDSDYGVSKAFGEAIASYYGISNNKGAFYDTTNARDELGFIPVDDASAPRG